MIEGSPHHSSHKCFRGPQMIHYRKHFREQAFLHDLSPYSRGRISLVGIVELAWNSFYECCFVALWVNMLLFKHIHIAKTLENPLGLPDFKTGTLLGLGLGNPKQRQAGSFCSINVFFARSLLK